MSNKEIAISLAKAATNKKAQEISLLDLNGKSDLCDFQIVCSGESDRQTQAIARELDRIARKELGIKPVATEGMQSGQWIVIDFGAIMVHVFQSDVRNYYAIDQLWPDAIKIDVPTS